MQRLLLLGAAALVASPLPAFAVCAVSPPTNGDLAAFAATTFPTADDAALDALLACLADPDPAVRDGFAFTLWSEGLRAGYLPPSGLRHATARLTTTLARADDAAGFARPFAALALSEVARTDRVAPWMSDAERRDLARVAAAYLRSVADYRGFTEGEGWRHGVAHGADLALQLALNPGLAHDDALLLMDAVAVQAVPAAAIYYHHGEPGRLARPILLLARRDDIDDAVLAAWFKALEPGDAPHWRAPFASDAKLSAIHNATAFAEAVYVGAAEAQDPRVRRLAPLAAGLLRAIP